MTSLLRVSPGRRDSAAPVLVPFALAVAVCAAALWPLPSVAQAQASGEQASGKPTGAQAGRHSENAEPGKDAAQVRELLRAIEQTSAAAERKRAIEELLTLGPSAVPGAKEFLARGRSATEATRREVLGAIKADVPNKDGRFRTPGRKETVNSGDDFDWLSELMGLDPGMSGLGEVIADVAAIRALAAGKSIAGAEAILDFAFTEDGLVYRDECGRYLRKMSPYSLPTLIRASQDDKISASQKRYANYQLDRMDRQDPDKVLNDAGGDSELLVAVIKAYGDSKHREAVTSLLRRADDDNDRIRAAAREASLAYVTGPPPPEAPKRKLVLPGGKLSEEEQPLWLTYRELADAELRRLHEEVIGQKPSSRATPEELTRQLFAHYDKLRAGKDGEAYDAAMALANAGNLAEAVLALDRILAKRPDTSQERRSAMARVYFEHAKQLSTADKWQEASAAFSKAHGLDREGELAEDALASHYVAMGKALEAEGKDGSAAYRRGRGTKPDGNAADQAVALREPKQARSRWMLYLGIGSGAGALILLILGLAVRRH